MEELGVQKTRRDQFISNDLGARSEISRVATIPSNPGKAISIKTDIRPRRLDHPEASARCSRFTDDLVSGHRRQKCANSSSKQVVVLYQKNLHVRPARLIALVNFQVITR
jgi:hypothetical protein